MKSKAKKRYISKARFSTSHEMTLKYANTDCRVHPEQVSPSSNTSTDSFWLEDDQLLHTMGKRRRWHYSNIKANQWKVCVFVIGSIGILGGFVYQASSFLCIFYEYPTYVEYNVSNEMEIEFPAVTVCNANPVKYKEWCKENPSLCTRKPGETLDDITRRQADEYDKLSKQERIALGYKYEDFVLYAEFDGEILTEPFSQFYDYEFTNCFTFNARWGDYSSVKTATLYDPSTGKSSELVICMNIDLENYSNMTGTPAGYIRMVMHDNDIIPNPSQDAARLETGGFYSYSIQKVTTILLEYPYQTNCRNYEEEREVRTGAKMSQKNCLLECYRNVTVEKCGCTYRRLFLMYGGQPCEYESQMYCLGVVEDKVYKTCSTKCPMGCKKVEFNYINTDKEPLPQESTFYENMALDNFFKNSKEMKKNMACVRIHHDLADLKTLQYQPRYVSVEVFSLLGGYSGLWLGFSILKTYSYFLVKVLEFVRRKKVCDKREAGKKPRKLKKYYR